MIFCKCELMGAAWIRRQIKLMSENYIVNSNNNITAVVEFPVIYGNPVD